MNPADLPTSEKLEETEREVAEIKAVCAALVDSVGDMVRLVEMLVAPDTASQAPAIEA